MEKKQYTYFKNIEKYHTKWLLTEVDNTNEHLENVEVHILELGKYRNIKNPNMENKLNQWLAFIDYERKELREMAIEKNESIKDAAKELERLAKARAEYIAEREEIWEHDRASELAVAKRKAEESGMQRGMQRGMRKGEEKMRKETATKMLELGADIEFIEKATGLPKEEILKIKENNA